jgi:hypothetical protein
MCSSSSQDPYNELLNLIFGIRARLVLDLEPNRDLVPRVFQSASSPPSGFWMSDEKQLEI